MGRPRKENDTETSALAKAEALNTNGISVLPDELEKKSNTFNNVPPVEEIRNSFGLLCKVNYKFTPEGFVDWRAMIPDEYVVLNREKYLKKSNPIDVATLSEEEYKKLKEKASEADKVIKLAGLKEVARIRGFNSIDVDLQPEGDRVIAKATINWISNYETKGSGNTNVGVAEAHLDNTYGLSQRYLASIAENRAIARAIRFFLNIHTVSQDEIRVEELDDFGSGGGESYSPATVVQKKVKDAKKSFEEFIQWIIESGEFDEMEQAKVWEKFTDIPAREATIILSKINGFLKK